MTPHLINSLLAYGAYSSSSPVSPILVAAEVMTPVPPREGSCAEGNTRAAGHA